jgi:phage shock protein A
MSKQSPPADSTASLSPAELRRRLLTATPPPMNAPAATAPSPDSEEIVATEGDEAKSSHSLNPPQDLLSRLKMPGGFGPASVPLTEELPESTIPDQMLGRQGHRRGGGGNGTMAGAINQLSGMNDFRYAADEAAQNEMMRIRGENKELRKLLEEMKLLLQEASDSEQQFVNKQKEFEKELAAKDAHIEELSSQLGAIEEQIAKGELVAPPPVPKTRTELEEWADELEKENSKLEKERKRLDNERRQLREDEEGMETQMREMEVQMARERAMIARQETELRRLSAEIQQELEMMQRGDSSLREQMSRFQRRAQEVLVTPPGGGKR